MNETTSRNKVCNALLSSLICLLLIYLLNNYFVAWVLVALYVFLALRNSSFHLWVPACLGFANFILFGYVDQTLEIYRSLIEDENVLQIILSIFNAFWTSIFIWHAGHLLEEKLHFSDKQKYSKALDVKEKNDIRICIKILKRPWKNFSRILGLLPIGGLIAGLSKVIFSTNFAENQSIIYANKRFGIIWLISLAFIFLCINLIHFYSEIIVAWNQKDISFGAEQLTREIGNRSLFDNPFEYGVLLFALLWLSIFTIPIVKAYSGVYSLGVIYLFIFIIMFDILVLIINWLEASKTDQKEKNKTFNCSLLLILIHVSFSVILLFLPPSFISNSFLGAKFWGALSIVSLSFSSLTVFFSTIYFLGNSLDSISSFRLRKLPLITLLIIFALTLSQLNLNDNHEIRYLPESEVVLDMPTKTIEASFSDWFINRKDREDYGIQGEYPVYIVSAQGGGIYAAYHAATALAKLHDNSNGKFSHHTFAISSVSGGSVGTSVYASLLKEIDKAKNNSDLPNNLLCNSLSECVKEALSEDFLSPLFSMALFPDLLQRFFPFKVNDWDRTRGLEFALEESLNRLESSANHSNLSKNPLEEDYLNLWNAEGDVPALILNTTVVETGERLTFSPFKLTSPAPKTMLDYDTRKTHVPLSTAAVLSARFPVFTPAGWFSYNLNDDDSRKLYRSRLVDGGYYDNSGIATAQDIINILSTSPEVDKLIEQTGLKPKFINLAIVDAPQSELLIDASDEGINEIFSPIRAIFNVRNARAKSIVSQAEYKLNQGAEDNKEYRFRALYLDKNLGNGISLPLGWLLSNASQKAIEDQVPEKDISLNAECNIWQESSRKVDVKMNNYCVPKLIYEETNGNSEDRKALES